MIKHVNFIESSMFINDASERAIEEMNKFIAANNLSREDIIHLDLKEHYGDPRDTVVLNLFYWEQTK